jgi:hypothetical protein
LSQASGGLGGGGFGDGWGEGILGGWAGADGGFGGDNGWGGPGNGYEFLSLDHIHAESNQAQVVDDSGDTGFSIPANNGPEHFPGLSTGGSTGVKCFPAGTPVSTEQGLRPIQEVRAGDRVWAFDHATESWQLRAVLECYQSRHEGDFVIIEVAGETITSTPGHPFWVIEGRALPARPQPDHVPAAPARSRVPGRWVDAGDLQVGDVLLLKEERFATIATCQRRPASEPVYNFQVDDLHCYAVGVKQVLVHNNSALASPGGGGLGGAPSQCFLAGTMVSTQVGLRPIQEVVEDDLVWSCDHFSGKWKLCKVEKLCVADYQGSVVALTVADEVLEVTPGHPFWVVEGDGLASRRWPEHVLPTVSGSVIPGRWVDAGELQAGDRLLLQSGKSAPISAVTWRTVETKVFNFQVADLHCYAVGSHRVLVHNKKAWVSNNGSSSNTGSPTYRPGKRPSDSYLGAALEGLQEGWNGVSTGWLKAGGAVDDGIYNLVVHPVDTTANIAQGLANTVIHPVDTATGFYDNWQQKFADNPSEALGEIGFGAAFAATGLKAGEAFGPKATKYCFPKGTLVDTAAGKRPIEEIHPDEFVWAFDHTTRNWRLCRVLQVFCQIYSGRSVRLKVAGETIEATYLHPFWVVRGEYLSERPSRSHLPGVPKSAILEGRWVDAGDLVEGDLVFLRDGRIVPVESLTVSPFHDSVYNLDVDELHCYGIGINGILVHNSNGEEIARGPKGGRKHTPGHRPEHIKQQAKQKGAAKKVANQAAKDAARQAMIERWQSFSDELRKLLKGKKGIDPNA